MNEKKINSCKKFVVEYLVSALELEKKLESESSDRAKKKLEKKSHGKKEWRKNIYRILINWDMISVGSWKNSNRNRLRC